MMTPHPHAPLHTPLRPSQMMIPIAEAVLSSLESSASDSYLPSHAPLRHEVTHHKVHIRRIGTPSRRDEIVRPDGGGSGGSTMHAAHGGDAAGAAPACDDEHAPPTGSVGSDGEGADLSARRGGGASKAVERSLGKGLMLGVAWAANVGGMATLTGTGPNIVLAGGITALFPESPGLSFATWLVFAAPMALTCLLVIWWAISATYLPRGRPPYDPAATLFLIQTQRRELGQISYREMCVLADFALLAVLWITRSPGFIPGWGELFDGYATDATTAVFMATLLFAIPARPPYLLAYLYRVASLSCGRASTAEGGSTARAGAEAAQFHASSEIEMSSDAETPPAAKTILQPGSSPNPASTLEPGSIPDGCSDAELEVVQLRTCDSAGSVSVDAQVGEGSLHGYGPHSTARHTRRAGARPSGDEAPATSRSQHRQPAGAVPKAAEANGALVSWPEIQARVPWGVLLLLGGGFALAEACRSSGLSALLGQQLSSLGALPPTLVLLLLMLLAAGISTFTSNVATTSILLPVIAALAGSMRVHPYYFMVPVTLTTSLAFILPVSTPPNALAFASGRLAVRDMAPLGLVLCLVCLLVVFGFTLAMGDLVFGTGSLPSWADPTANNGTAAPTA